MWSGTRSVGSRTMPSGKSPISSIAAKGTLPSVRWAHGCRSPRIASARCVPGRGRAPRRGPYRWRRPFSGDRHESALRRPASARSASLGERGARRAAARRHDSRTANQDERDDMSEISDNIKNVIENEPVALFMKGTPEFVMCGNSDRALRALREAGAPVTAVNVLPDPAIRQALSELSGWPTIPQVFVGGELVGGADIVQELAETGKLPEILAGKLGESYRDAAAERVVDVLTPAQR